MKLKDKCTIQRMLGWIEGISVGLDDKLSSQLCDAVEVIDGIIDKEECDDEQLKHEIDTMPTVELAEVKHGEWFLLDECSNEGVYCSLCHKKVYRKNYANQKVKSNYCPNCGARMDGGAE